MRYEIWKEKVSNSVHRVKKQGIYAAEMNMKCFI